MTTRVFLDTNILLDFFLERPYDREATREVFARLQSGEYQGVISDISLLNVSYIARKYRDSKAIYDFLEYLLDICILVRPTFSDFRSVLSHENRDFEDAIQMTCADQVGAIVLTRDPRWFDDGRIVYTSRDFITL